MDKLEIKNLIQKALDNLDEISAVEERFCAPIRVQKTTIIPINKLSYGFLIGDSELGKKIEPIGLSSGGLSLVPLGFLVVDEYGETNLIKIEGGTTDKWWDTIQKLVKSFL